MDISDFSFNGFSSTWYRAFSVWHLNLNLTFKQYDDSKRIKSGNDKILIFRPLGFN